MSVTAKNAMFSHVKLEPIIIDLDGAILRQTDFFKLVFAA